MRFRSGVLALVAALLAAGLAGCSASDGDDRPVTGAEVAALLARHGAAVLHRDRTAFLADVDGTGPAAPFSAQQRSEFDNLTELPLATWSYRVGPPVHAPQSQRAARRRYGPTALIVRLDLRYRLRGVDTVTAEHDLWWTFVRHDGRVQAVADDSLATAGGRSWQGPWDFGPLDVVRGRSSLVLGPAGDGAQLQEIADAVDAVVPAVSAVWGSAWSRDVAVIVPADAAALAAALPDASVPDTYLSGAAGNASASDDAALSASGGADPLTGRAVEPRLVVEPGPFSRLSDVGRTITVTHEVTHVASARATNGASPRWLVEGLAEYVGNLHSGQPVRRVASELGAQIRRGVLPTQLPPEAAFDAPGTAAVAYEQSWLACRLIAQRAGQDALVRFYAAVGASPDDSDTAVDAALSRVLHESRATFVAQWRAYLRAELG